MGGMRHVPNLITALRFLLIPVLVLLLVEQRFAAAFAVFVVSALSDLADGMIARRWNLRTRLGAMADPLADKLTMLAVTVVLATQALIPLWLAAAIVARDLVIVAGAVAFHVVVGRVEMAPSWLSKFNTVLEFSVLSALLADAARTIEVTAWLPPLFVLVTATIVASGVHYVWVWGRRALRSKRAATAAEPR
ncbi:MAG TPA: CDP-alcohol phosphatidyltransferase family protein [Burkholderiaceae bacterium]|nr:CDP-alcohol phosphatidyltransferase family protein [Burkholderiaceae bacterium]